MIKEGSFDQPPVENSGEENKTMQRFCMNCGKDLGEKASDREGISHGFCEECKKLGFERKEIDSKKPERKCRGCGINLDVIKEEGEGGFCRKCCIEIDKGVEEQGQFLEKRDINDRGK